MKIAAIRRHVQALVSAERRWRDPQTFDDCGFSMNVSCAVALAALVVTLTSMIVSVIIMAVR